jgi:hypothetical protein
VSAFVILSAAKNPPENYAVIAAMDAKLSALGPRYFALLRMTAKNIL